MIPSILYSDMDGTLIHEGRISQENQQAIRRFVEAGGAFSVATGRSELSAYPFTRQLPITLPAILYNGAAVYDFQAGVFLKKTYLPRPVFEAMYGLVRRSFTDILVEAFAGGPIALLPSSGNKDPYIQKEKQPVRYASAPEVSGVCFKLLFYGEPERLHELEAAFAEDTALKEAGPYCLLYSMPYYLEVLPKDATKGDALSWLFGYLGKGREAFAAIGDFDNDVSMIAAAGLGAAPADAQPCALEAAAVRTAPHTQSAVADFIDRFLLGGGGC